MATSLAGISAKETHARPMFGRPYMIDGVRVLLRNEYGVDEVHVFLDGSLEFSVPLATISKEMWAQLNSERRHEWLASLNLTFSNNLGVIQHWVTICKRWVA